MMWLLDTHAFLWFAWGDALIERRHAIHVATLPLHHRDPFDRILVAQSQLDGIPLVSGDFIFDAYPVTRVW